MRMSGTNGNSLYGVLSDPRVYRAVRDEVEWYSAAGVIEVLTESADSMQRWQELKKQEPALAALANVVEFGNDADTQAALVGDGLTIDGVMRLVQSISSPRSERIKRWLVDSAHQRLDEADDPELALLRARRLYERRGYSRRWIDKRLRGMSARQELTSEWYRRGARESEDYRGLTNTLLSNGFGKDVETYRRHKGLRDPRQNLRDHMNDLELTLLSLAEVTAAVLHRDRGSQGVDQLTQDVQHAGEIVASTISQIEAQSRKPVVYPGDGGPAANPSSTRSVVTNEIAA